MRKAKKVILCTAACAALVGMTGCGKSEEKKESTTDTVLTTTEATTTEATEAATASTAEPTTEATTEETAETTTGATTGATAEATTTEESVTEAATPPSELPSMYTNAYGFTMTYSAAAFSAETSDMSAVFRAIGSDTAYVSVSVSQEMTLDELADGLVLQSGQEDVSAEDATFGANGYPSKAIYYTKGTDYIQFNLIQGDGFVVMIETYTSESETQSVKDQIEALLGSFTME